MMVGKSLYLVFFIITIFLGASIQASPYKTTMSGEFTSLNKITSQYFNSNDNSIGIYNKSKNKPRFNLKIPGFGIVVMMFTSVKPPNWTSLKTSRVGTRKDPLKFVILKGEARKLGTKLKLPIVGTVHKNNKNSSIASFYLVEKNNSKRNRFHRIKVNVANTNIKREARIESISMSENKSLSCGIVNNVNKPSKNRKIKNSATEVKVATLSIDADFEFFKKYGEESNAVTAAIVEAASEMYTVPFGLKFEITSQNVFTAELNDPYGSTDPLDMLLEFQSYHQNVRHLPDADIYHLFTGRNMDGSTVGIAYIGVICTSPQNSYGITQSFHPLADASIFAHEIGHNLNGQHDESSPGTLMYPSINVPGSKIFSNTSKLQIGNFVDNATCFSTTTVEPTPITPPIPTATPITRRPSGNPDMEDPDEELPDDDFFEVFLNGKVTKNGKATLTIDINQEETSGCAVQLLGIPFTGSDKVTLYEGIHYTFPFNLNGKALNRSTGKVEFFVTVNCPDDGIATDSLITRMHGRRRRIVLPEDWLNRLNLN
jgi:hypothetical protein